MKILKICSLILSTLMVSSVFASDMKVGFIYIGPPGDHGWNYQHDVGRKAVDEAFDGKVETVFQENVPESADAERVMTQMALSGADMIFATSFGYMDPVINVAKKFPNVKTLSQANEEVIYSMWKGLGYYNRAKNLHKTANEVLQKWDGQLPEIEEDLLVRVRMRLHLFDLIYVLMEGEALDMEARQPDIKFFEKYVLIKLSHVTKKDPR